MTRQGLYEVIASWVTTQVMGSPGVSIFRAYQDKAAPTKGCYILIDDGTSWERIGQHAVGEVNELQNNRQLKNDYEVKIELWEIRGDGEVLQGLLESLDTREVHEYFEEASCSIPRVTSPVQKMPEVLNTATTQRRYRAEITCNVSREVREQAANIVSIDIVDEITT